jgi:hypothetical protein
MPGPAAWRLRPLRPLGAASGRSGPWVSRKAVPRPEGIIAAIDERHQARLERLPRFAREVDRVVCAAEQPAHLCGLVLLLDVDQGLKFAQMMGIARDMIHARDGVI